MHQPADDQDKQYKQAQPLRSANARQTFLRLLQLCLVL
jgi:hypothetical protein